jgi:hypothetical protein
MRAWIATLILAGIPAGCSSSAPAKPADKPAPGKPPPGEIVTEQVLKMNSAEYGRPAATFRPGTVSSIAAPKSTRTATGF